MSTITNKKLAPTLVTAAELISRRGLQQQSLSVAFSSHNVDNSQMSVGTVVMAPGGVAKFHVHNKYDVLLLLLEGHAATLFGEDLEPIVQRPGEFIHIPHGVPHTAVNLSMEHRIVGLECRADPDFNVDVELIPHLDLLVPPVAEKLRAEYAGKHPVGVINNLW